jgi:hypothetical protein
LNIFTEFFKTKAFLAFGWRCISHSLIISIAKECCLTVIRC